MVWRRTLLILACCSSSLAFSASSYASTWPIGREKVCRYVCHDMRMGGDVSISEQTKFGQKRREILEAFTRLALASTFVNTPGLVGANAEDGDSWSLLRGGASQPSATFRKPSPAPVENDPLDESDDEISTVAEKRQENGDDPWAEEDNEDYKNPNIPQAPEERSGLVVLRVAEVATFQEKILRAVASGELDVPIAPNQIQFGIEILLKNSNLDGNMKLMINGEIPEEKRPEGATYAARAMNGLQTILTTAAGIQRPFTRDDMVEIADLYNFVAYQLDEMYQLLPPEEKDKYYGYFRRVTEYEKKVADGTYNPDIDGVLELK